MLRFLSNANPRLFAGKVLLRLDFNTEDNWRIEAVLPTLKLLIGFGSKIIIVSHRGRPRGQEKKLSLRKNVAVLKKMLRRDVIFIPHFHFKEIGRCIDRSAPGSIFLLENLRFNPGEEANDDSFARKLASLADVYVNDAFAVSHRANASVVAITKHLCGYAGLELEREIQSLSRVMRNPRRPLIFIAGGAKAADKLDAIKYFQHKADYFLLGGGPANTIFALRGMEVKKSVRDTDLKDINALRSFAKSQKVIMPSDVRWHGDFIWDIGPDSEREFSRYISRAGTVIWSGPLGFIEKAAFSKGSIAMAKAIVKNKKIYSVSGGGETVMFLKKYKFDKKFSFISTGGGAMIDFLAGKKLPGIKALEHSRS